MALRILEYHEAPIMRGIELPETRQAQRDARLRPIAVRTFPLVNAATALRIGRGGIFAPETGPGIPVAFHAAGKGGQQACFLRLQEHLAALVFPTDPRTRFASEHQ